MTPDIRRRAELRRTLFDLYIDGQPVSHAVVHDLVMWIQGAKVRAGGVGGVTTAPEHRGKGHARVLLEAVIQDMIRQGYIVSLLFGIPDYYDRLGYAPFMAFWSVRIRLEDAARATGRGPTPVPLPAGETDRGRIVDWYNAMARPRGASMARDPGTFRDFRWGTYRAGQGQGFVVRAPGEPHPFGYFACRVETGRVTVIEAACPDTRHYTALLAALAGMARERGCEEIRLEIPADDPFARYLTGSGCVVEARYPRMSDGMLRILDPAALTACLRERLERKLERTPYRACRVVLEGGIEIGTTGGRPIHAEGLTPASLAQLVTGYRSAQELLGPGEAAEVLDALLAGQVPYVWQADRF